MNKIILSNLTDYQKSLLTRLAYLDIDFKQFKKIKEIKSSITISDLKSITKYPDEPYLGSLRIPQLKRVVTGITTTNLELINEIEQAGLANLKIIDFASDAKTGFNGICFKDSLENVGFSFRGTDPKTLSSLATDSLADVEAFLTDSTKQIEQAQMFFNQNKNDAVQNFLYGHSLGGFLAESVYLKNHPCIYNIFVVNPLHINSKLLDNPAKIAAFNSPNKFQCFVTGGDYVSSINPPELFENNIHYVENNKETVNNPIGNHLVEAGKVDINGNFVECPKEVAFEGHTDQIMDSAIHVINNNRIKGFFRNAFINSKKWLVSTKSRLTNLFKRKPKEKKDQPKQKTHSDLDKYVLDEDEIKNIKTEVPKDNSAHKTVTHSVPDHEHE